MRTALVVSLVGCEGAKETTERPKDTADTEASRLVSLSDVGTACAYGDGAPQTPGALIDTTFLEGEPYEVVVVLDDCVSGCASEIDASCAVRLVGGEIVVSAVGSYSVPSEPTTCLDVCLLVVATCPADPLAAGYWTLDYGGGHSDGFAVPGTVLAPCATSLVTP